jgi:hypothetical protein
VPNAADGHRLHAAFGRLEHDPEADALRCHVCGHGFRNLAQHARRTHGLDAAAYRELAGLNRRTRLVTPSLSERLREATAPTIARLRAEGKLRNWGEDPERLSRDKAAAVEALHGGLRAEGRDHRREWFTEERRRDLSERRRERNLSGEDRADGAAISRGLRRAAGGPRPCERCGGEYRPSVARQRYCEECRAVVARERGRDSKRRARLRAEHGEAAAPRRADPLGRDQGRDTACGRCRDRFRAASHRERYCHECRPVRQREYQRDWKRARRRSSSDGASGRTE